MQIFCYVSRTAESARAWQAQLPFHTFLLAFCAKKLNPAVSKQWEKVPAWLECRKDGKDWVKEFNRKYFKGGVVCVKDWL